jgi:hypothetical protein
MLGLLERQVNTILIVVGAGGDTCVTNQDSFDSFMLDKMTTILPGEGPELMCTGNHHP